ncbi:MAG: YcjF family protein [Thiolinea sp.]
MKWAEVKQLFIRWWSSFFRRVAALKIFHPKTWKFPASVVAGMKNIALKAWKSLASAVTKNMNLKLGARLMARKEENQEAKTEEKEAATVSAEVAAEKVVAKKKPAASKVAPVEEKAATTTEETTAVTEDCVSQEGNIAEGADTLAEVIDEAQEVAANGIVKNHIIASIALGLVPVPLFDLAALTATQMSMLRNLSEHYDVSFEESGSKALLTSLVGGSLPVLGAVGFSSFIKLIPGIGTLGGSASLSIVAGAVTYAIGQTFIMHFEQGGTFEDFDPKLAREFFQREVNNGKEFVQNMRDELDAMKEKGSEMVDQVQEKGSQIAGKDKDAAAEPETAKA